MDCRHGPASWFDRDPFLVAVHSPPSPSCPRLDLTVNLPVLGMIVAIEMCPSSPAVYFPCGSDLPRAVPNSGDRALLQVSIPARLRHRSWNWIAFASFAVASIGLSGCSDAPSKDSKITDRPDGKTVGEGSFKPNVTPTKVDAKAEPL
jgi:hypothetical protein